MGLTCLSFINTGDLSSRILWGGLFYFLGFLLPLFCLFVFLDSLSCIEKKESQGETQYVTIKSEVVLV